MTVEPGVYRSGFGGIRIEDLVTVTSDGFRNLTTLPEGRPMPAITTNDLKNGITLNLDNGLFQVVDFQHVKPGKGGAFVRTKLRNVRTGAVLDRTFNAGVKVDQAIVNKQDMQFLYRDGDDYVFMNTSTYEQLHVAPAALGEAAGYLVEQAIAQIAVYEGEIISVEIPAVGRARPSPTPSRVCRATACPVPASPPRWRPARCSRCRCSSRSATVSRSTPAAASTSPASDVPPVLDSRASRSSSPAELAASAPLWRLTQLEVGEMMNRRPDARSDARERAPCTCCTRLRRSGSTRSTSSRCS